MAKAKYKVATQIKRKGFPTSSPVYREAHSEALQAEKKAFPKGYKQLKKLGNEKRFPANRLMGSNSKQGKIKVAKKAGKVTIPKKFDNEIAFHEIKEHQAFGRLQKNARRRKK